MTLALPMKRPVLTPGWSRNELTRKAKASPSLDLRFADSKSLIDATTGQNLVTFTRASSGTYVGSDGLIKTATTNLLLQSENFSTTWGTNNLLAFGSGSTVDAAIAPDGRMTADLITEDTSASVLHRAFQTLTVSNGPCTVSVYAKRAVGSRNLEVNADAIGGARAVFDLGTGTVGEITSGTASIQAVGSGWYRCSVTGTSVGATTSLYFQLCTGTTSASRTYTGDGTSGIYIWGAQLEQSSTVGEYIPTTSTINSAPRFDHNPTTGESLGLLVEESKTNLLLQSENFSTTWSSTALLAFGSGSTVDAIAAPNGTITADLLVENTAASTHNTAQAISFIAGNAYTFSVWVKAFGRNVRLTFPAGAFTNAVSATFNTATGALNATSNSPTSTSATAFSDGWRRFSITATATTTASASLSINLISGNNTVSYTGDGTSGIYLWGAQLEAGAFPTSYIPTTTATVTRSADVASISGSNFSSWYDVNGGTVFSEFDSAMPDSGNVLFTWTLWNSSPNYLGMRTATGYNPDRLVAVSRVSGSNAFTSEGNSNGYINMPIGATKGAFAFAANSFGVAWDGGTPFGSSSGAIPSGITKLDLGSQDSFNILNGHIRRLTYWAQRLPNETLQTITQ